MNDMTKLFTPDVPSIASAAMLVELNISVWTGRRQDKSLSAKSEADAHAKSGTFSTYKKLLGDCPELKAISDSAAAMRGLHIRNTMPWSDKGPRLLTTKRFFEYEPLITRAADEHEKLVSVFADDVYAVARADAFRALGEAYNPSDYPTTEAIRDKFRFSLTYSPVPDAADFRVDVGNDALRKLETQYSDFYQKRIEDATNDVVSRLTAEMERFVNQLAVNPEDGTKGKLYQSTIDHVLSLATMAEEANFAGDPDITRVCARINDLLDGSQATAIKKSDADRAHLHREMKKAVDAIPSLGMS